MKRRDLVRMLEQYGCVSPGRRLALRSVNRAARKVSTVPRHREINNELARKILKDLEIPQP